jgi:Flp pilus assembly protein TadB
MKTAQPTLASPGHRTETATLPDMLWEVGDLAGGAVIVMLPLLLLAVPSAVLFVLLPALVLLAVATVVAVALGAVLLPAWLLTRAVARARTRFRSPRRGTARSAPTAHGRVAPC